VAKREINKILFVCGEPPYPPINGVRIPTWNMIKTLRELCQIEVLLVSDIDDIMINNDDAKKDQKYKCGFFHYTKQYNIVVKLFMFLTTRSPSYALKKPDKDELTNFADRVSSINPDVVIFDAEWLGLFADGVPEGVYKVISPNDSISLALSNELGFKIHKRMPKRIFTYLNYKKSIAFEKSIYSKFDLCHFVSSVDEEYVRKMESGLNTFVSPNGVDSDYFNDNMTTYPSACNVIFVGALMGGNLIYIKNFIANVWVKLKEKYPSIKLTLVSRVDPGKAFREKCKDFDIEIMTGVNDLRPLYRTHGLVLSPVEKVCGILNKVLEGMAMSRVVIGFSSGFTGTVNAEHGRHYLCAKTAAGLFDLFCEVYEGSYDLERIASEARILVEEKYNWDRLVRGFYYKIEGAM